MNWPEWLDRAQYYFNELVLFKIQDVGVTLAHITVAFVIFLSALIFSKVLRMILQKKVFNHLRIDAGVQYALLRFIHYIILGVGLYVSLSSMNIPLGALVGLFAVIGVGIGFGLQNLASNFISGVILLVERPVKVGDRIEVDDVWGDVERINLRTTLVRTPDEVSIIVPNSKLLENNVTNFSHRNRIMRLRVPIGVAYGSDVDLVTECLKQAAEGVEGLVENKPVDVWFTGFGSSSLDFEVLCWIREASRRYWVLDRVNRNLNHVLMDKGIEIPFPQRDLHLRSIQTESSLHLQSSGLIRE